MSLEAFFSSGTVAWFILAVMAIEALVLAKLMAGSRSYPAMLAGLAAGAFLVLALWAALTRRDVLEIALFLGMSFVAHAMEIRFWLGARNNK